MHALVVEQPRRRPRRVLGALQFQQHAGRVVRAAGQPFTVTRVIRKPRRVRVCFSRGSSADPVR
ncbi:hypothetical protein [Streptomyces sp. NPDC052107]|uniref:hypothetical protein n=1 Tax=Streptomyces sp. NPDC052107 TaxID=3155632 RepID=UPI00341A9A8D